MTHINSLPRPPWTLVLLFAVITTSVVAEDSKTGPNATLNTSLERILAGDAPQSVPELRAMQVRVRDISEQVMASTVSVGVGVRHGSGVIISSDGYVLTAAHVIEEPNRRVQVTLHNGRRVGGRTLGVFRTVDAGLIKITEKNDSSPDGKWPAREMANSEKVEPGQWCLATGHPNGFQQDRKPVVRLGRVLSVTDKDDKQGITSDCTLVGGDSGGPLYDLDGKVIGIHSRIGGSLALNIHIPVNAFRDNWDRLAAGESWGHFPGTEPFIGVQGDRKASDARLAEVFPNTPAAKAGLRPGDIITKFDREKVTSFDSLVDAVALKKPGDRVQIEFRRMDRLMSVEITVGKREN